MTDIEFNDQFKLPIYYNDEKVVINSNIVNDLELIKSIDISCNPIYSFLFDSSNEIKETFSPFRDKITEQFSEYYTTDKQFLKETQNILTTYSPLTEEYKLNNIVDIWNEVKKDNGFKDKYFYVDWKQWEFLNKSEQFLQISSIYNMASPIFSLFLPIIILIIPFFIIRLKGLNLTMVEYIDVLKIVISHHAIGKLFTNFNNSTLNQKVYLLLSAAFYVFSIYQNILSCIRFNSNMKKIHTHFIQINQYLEHTIASMNNFLKYSNELSTYHKFNNILYQKIQILNDFKTKISSITEYKLSFTKVFEVGNVLKCFYEFYENKSYEEAFLYSFGFNGYIDCIKGLQFNINERKINIAQFTTEKKKNCFKNNYYGPLKNDNPVKNNIKFNKNIIITGANASGKTTILKSTIINIILTQQFGFGFYDSAILSPYKYLHCYLNIPDTSGRDSLFQAEARRCKEIIDSIDNDKSHNHFCVFDELYSGTNPDEAVSSATSFMEYLVKNKNVSCLLTTHFTKVCKILKKNKDILNFNMKSLDDNNNKIKYTYELQKGISRVKGGISVLCDMNYPKEIIQKALSRLERRQQ
jgi:energy-coupling factor transporter ATP-binding protein EcfA2